MLCKNNINIEVRNEKAKRLLEMRKTLTSYHPHYSKLNEYNTLDFSEIKKHLSSNEIIYVNMISQKGICEFVISCNEVKNKYKQIDVNRLDHLTLRYSQAMQDDIVLNDEEIETIITELSSLSADLLYSCLSENNNIDTIYYCLDYEYRMFSLPCLKLGDNYLVEKVNSIVRLLDVSSILEKESIKPNGYIAKCIGNSQDTNLKQINNALKNVSNNLNVVIEENCTSHLNSMIIYGHGISNLLASKEVGAVSIDNQNDEIVLEDVLKNLNSDIKNLILISCSTGIPNNSQVEMSEGTWSNIMERYFGSIITCKWDVDTKKTIELLKNVIRFSIEENKSLADALVLAQRTAISSNIACRFWMPFDFYIN